MARVETLVTLDGLDLGEAEAIVLSEETGHRTLLMDDDFGVRVARSLELDVIRTAALYVAAKKHGLITTVRPKLDGLRSAGFWLADEHYRVVLERAEEL